MTKTYDLYHDFQPPSASRPGLFDRRHTLVEVDVPEERAARALGYIAVPHGAPSPDNTIDGRFVAGAPFDPVLAQACRRHNDRERRIAEALGEMSGLNARQRKRRRQKARREMGE